MIPYQFSFLDKGGTFSTIEVYLAAVSASHVGFGNAPVGQHSLIRRFVNDVHRLRPTIKPVLFFVFVFGGVVVVDVVIVVVPNPFWDLPRVLQVLPLTQLTQALE